jgi:dephospho-CoA kinase
MQNTENEENKDKILVLAVVGMPATGKSEVIKKLKDQFDFYHLYYGGITLDEVKRRGLELNEANEKFVREDMRSSGDMGIYSRFMIPKIEEAIQSGYKNILLESMYNIYEYEIIKEKYGENFKVLAIHTDTDIRIKRINSRKERALSKDELINRQISEAKKLQKGTVISFADFNYTNNDDDMEKFEKDLEEILKNKILKN